MKPFFSVIISVFNKEDYIINTLVSVLNQTYKHFEIIVVDDGSSDGSVEAIKSINDKRISLIATKNYGASHARNLGIENATSDYIALLDGDDEWEPYYLEFMYDAIQKFDQCKIFCSKIAQKYENKIVTVPYSFKQTKLYGVHNYFKSSQKFSLIHSSSVVFQKSILKQTGNFDTSIVSGQDTDLWIRFGLHCEVVFINKLLAYYIYNPSSLSNSLFDLSKKVKFDKYLIEEKENKLLKNFLDRNRYSMALMSKIQSDEPHFLFYTSHLNAGNLNLRQKVLLKSPRWLLKLLLKIKSLKKEKLYYIQA